MNVICAMNAALKLTAPMKGASFAGIPVIPWKIRSTYASAAKGIAMFAQEDARNVWDAHNAMKMQVNLVHAHLVIKNVNL